MNFFLSRKAQSGLEYTTMAVLVTLGILLMGPYVVRSINSQFKATEEGAKDSQREQITQAPEQNVQLPNCNCTDLLDNGCGVGATSANCLAVSENQVASQCGQRCKVFERQCDPMGCDVDMRRLGVIGSMLECRNDPDAVCCEPLISTGLCGAQGLNTPGGRCPDGRMKWYKDCGSPTSTRKYECIVDPICNFICIGPSSGNSTECSNTQNDLLGSAPWTYTMPGTVCSDQPKCQATCKAGHVPVAGGCIAHCPNGVCEPQYDENHSTCPQDCTLYGCPYDWALPTGGAWASFGCIGQVHVSHPYCTNFVWQNYTQNTTLACPATNGTEQLYICPASHNHFPGQWVSMGCHGQVSLVNYCTNFTWQGQYNTAACTPWDPASQPIQLYECPDAAVVQPQGGAWASFGCSGQLSTVSTCTNECYSNCGVTFNCSPISYPFAVNPGAVWNAYSFPPGPPPYVPPPDPPESGGSGG